MRGSLAAELLLVLQDLAARHLPAGQENPGGVMGTVVMGMGVTGTVVMGMGVTGEGGGGWARAGLGRAQKKVFHTTGPHGENTQMGSDNARSNQRIVDR